VADVVNLKRARKADARIKKAAKATENAAKFGLSKAQKQAQSSDRIKAARHLDNHRLDTDG
jgi:uncharacterized protein DUF4169